MNRNALSWCWKARNDGVAWTVDGRLFHARGAATGKANSPSVDQRTGRTTRAVEADELSTSAARRMPSAGRVGPCHSNNGQSEHRGGSVSALELATSVGCGGAA